MSLYAWKKQFQAGGYVVPKTSDNPDHWDARAKLAAVIATDSMNEAERSTYCREHSLYVEQLDAWKQAFETMGQPDSAATKRDLRAARKKNRKLEKELRRKDKALSETSALLALSKKAEAIWGTDEDD